MRAVMNTAQLREALRVAEELEAQMEREATGTDSAQVHLIDQEGVLRIDLFSNEEGRVRESWTVDAGQAPGETGKAVRRTWTV